MIFVAIYVAEGLFTFWHFLSKFKKFGNKSSLSLGLIFIVVVSSFIPSVVSVRSDVEEFPGYADDSILQEETFNLALYTNYEQGDFLTFSNVEALNEKVGAYALVINFKPLNEGTINYNLNNISTLFSGNVDYLMQGENYAPPLFYSVLLRGESLDSQKMQNSLKYNLVGEGRYGIITLNSMESSIMHKGSIENSTFLLSTKTKTFKTYDDGFQSLHVLYYNKVNINV